MMGRDTKKFKTTEMKMLPVLFGKILKDKISKDEIRKITGMGNINEVLQEQRLRWLTYVERMDKERESIKVLNFE